MIKQTLYFSNPAYLRVKLRQLVIELGDEADRKIIRRPIEDIGMILLDHPQITISHNAIRQLQANNTVIVSCDEKHMPYSMMLPMEGHSLQSKRYRIQLQASQPLKKNLWQQTVVAKINNQATVLDIYGKDHRPLEALARKVNAGDTGNIEAHAAALYWEALFGPEFTRERYGDPPNNLLNYGYAIIRSLVARALVSSGLHLTLGLYHKNQYNAFCLADDVMEPFRPFVDLLVYEMYEAGQDSFELDIDTKKKLLSLCTMDALFGKRRSPLMVGVAHTTSSLFECFAGRKRRIKYPKLDPRYYDTFLQTQ